MLPFRRGRRRKVAVPFLPVRLVTRVTPAPEMVTLAFRNTLRAAVLTVTVKVPRRPLRNGPVAVMPGARGSVNEPVAYAPTLRPESTIATRQYILPPWR